MGDVPNEKLPVAMDGADPTLINWVEDVLEDSRIGIESLNGDLLQFETFSFLSVGTVQYQRDLSQIEPVQKESLSRRGACENERGTNKKTYKVLVHKVFNIAYSHISWEGSESLQGRVERSCGRLRRDEIESVLTRDCCTTFIRFQAKRRNRT